METKKRMQRFLSIFLACIMILNVPMSALAYEDVMVLDTVEDLEVYAEQEEAISGETALEEEIVDAEVIEENNSADTIPAEGTVPEASETNDVEDLIVDEQSADGFAVEGIEVMSAEPQLEGGTESTETAVLTLDQTELVMLKDETATLKVTVNLPKAEEGSESAAEPNVTWNSSDTAVATVENGTITAVKVGTTTVTASVSDANGTYTASCAVEVAEGGNNCGASGSNVSWKLTEDGTLTISGTGATVSKGPWNDPRPYKDHLSKIKKLIVEEGVTKLGNYALSRASNLSSITLASSVGELGQYAFSKCNALETVEIPATVTTIGASVFRECTGLKTVTYKSSAATGEYMFWDCTSLESVTFTGAITTLNNAFRNSGIKEIVVPATVTSVYMTEFMNCKKLEKVTLNGSGVGESMFKNCTALKEIVVGEKAEALTKTMFTGCTALEKLTVDEKNPNNKHVKDHMLYSTDGKTLEYCVPGKTGEVILPEGITAIGDGAFNGCSKITKVVIPEGVTTVGEKAFEGCSSLAALVVPEALKDLDVNSEIFTGCTALKEITVNVKNENNVVAEGKCGVSGTDVKWILTEDGTMTISGTGATVNKGMFNETRPYASYLSQIKKLVVEDGVTGLGDYAFCNASNLTSITLASSVKTIGQWAFSSCNALEEVEIPATVTAILGSVFRNDAGLKKVIYHSTVLGEYMFWDCINLESITFTGAITEFNNSFNGCGLKEIVVPETVTSIYTTEFKNCKNLDKVTLMGSGVGSNMFTNCTALKEVVVGEKAGALAKKMFTGCTSLEKLTVAENNPNNKHVKENILYSTDGTTLEYCVPGKTGEVNIPAGVTTIGEEAFKSCTKITKVQVPEGVTQIGKNAFSGCTSLETVVLPESLTNLASDAFAGCASLKNILVNGENAGCNFVIENGVAYSKDGKQIMFVLSGTEGEVTIKEGITVIPEGAFADCKKITKVTLPTSVTTIGANAFAGCTSMTEFIMPNSVSSIGRTSFENCSSLKNLALSTALKEIPRLAFGGCSALEELVVPEGVTTIGTEAFRDCSSLVEVSLPSTLREFQHYSETNGDGYQFAGCSALKHFEIPEGVKVIPGYLLDECYALEYIVIPSSIEEVKSNGLSGFYVYVTQLYYKAGPSQWKNIKKPSATSIAGYPSKWYYEVPRETGLITAQPVGASYKKGETAVPFTISTNAPESGISYRFKWHSNTDPNTETGEAFDYYVSSTDTTSTVSPATSSIGSMYYYCVVEKRDAEGNLKAVEMSDLAKVLVVDDTLIGGGTAENPFKISSAEDLKKVSKLSEESSLIGVYFQLTDNIQLDTDWQPIGKSYRFAGIIDGNGKTIRYAKGSLPLVERVYRATIKNLKIYGEEIKGYGLVNDLEGVGLSGEAICIDNVTLLSGSSTLESGLIGTKLFSNGYAGCSANYYVTIKNCTIEKGVTIGYKKNKALVGSIAGRMHGTIDNCVSYADVYGTDHVGGILGMRDNAMGNCAVTNCTFGGNVYASDKYAGGIVGGGYNDSSAPNGGKVNVNECTVTGNVTGLDNVGGIVGGDPFVAQLWSAQTLKFNSFTGKVSATGGNNVGGIIGYYKSLNKFDDIVGNYYAADCGAQRGIGAVEIVDTNCASHETTVGHTYINTETTSAGCPVVTGCTWQIQHNRTDDPLGADADKLATSKKNMAAYVKKLVISGDYKTEYYVGQEFDLTGMEFTAKWLDGSITNPKADEVTVTGFDSSKAGTQNVIITYQSASAEIKITVKRGMRVTFSLLGDSKHDSDKDGNTHTLQMNNLENWVPKTAYYYSDMNTTVYDVIKDAAKQYGFTIGARDTQYGLYIESITWKGLKLSELDNGKNSGWMCTVNGIHPNVNLAAVYVENGDDIIFHYTDDYTQEESLLYDKQMAEEITETITALPSVDKLSASDKAAVQAAREAYEALSAAQKEHVSAETLKQLEAAEARIAELEKNAHVHSWDAGTVTKAPTCTATGVKTYKCGCGESKAETIPALGHKFGAWTTVSEATVKAAEVQKHTCSVCGASETQNVGSKLTAVLQIPGKLSSFNMKKGKTTSFKVTMANGDSVTSVKSNKTKVLKATLDQKTGKITLKALKTGTAKLTINLDSKTSKTYTVKVVTGTVKTTGVSVTSVTNKKLTLEKGKTHTLKTEVKPFTTTQNPTYKSSNKKVATVTSKGKIEAVAPGKATITVKSGSQSVKITVTVPGITNVKSSVTVKKNKTTTLKPKTYGISGKVTYTSSNPKVATVTSKGKVKGIKKGTAKITIQAGTFKKTVTIKVK